jgi:uroporphyrinogen decarboxylase
MADRSPDVTRFVTALRREEPDCVPASEFLVDPPVKAAFLGRHVGNSLLGTDDYDVAADVAFWAAAGYDYIHLAPWYLHLFPQGWNVIQGEYSEYSEAPVDKAWMEEHQGVIRTRADFERYPWPDPSQASFDHLHEAGRLLPAGMGLTTGTWGVLETSRQLMGFEGMAYALHDDPGLVEAVVERMGAFLFALLQKAAAIPGVAALWICDDIAHAEGLFFSPDFYRRVLFPWFRKYGEVAARLNVPLIYHNDGRFWEVIPDLVDCGITALQPIEPKAMDIVEVKRQWGQHLALIGNIDLGGALTRGTPAEVEAEVRARLRELAPGGGYCVGSSNSIATYVPLENYRALLEATRRWGAYPIRA